MPIIQQRGHAHKGHRGKGGIKHNGKTFAQLFSDKFAKQANGRKVDGYVKVYYEKSKGQRVIIVKTRQQPVRIECGGSNYKRKHRSQHKHK